MIVIQGSIMQCFTFCLLIAAIIEYVLGEKVSVHYEVPAECGLAGLRCLSENVEFRRNVRFGTTSTTSDDCKMLDQDMNVNATHEPGVFHMKMLSYEIPFAEDFEAKLSFPPSFDVRCHFDVIFKTPDSKLRWFQFSVQDSIKDVNTTFIHVHFRPSKNHTVLRSKHSGNWSEEIITPNPVTQQNTVYRATVYLYETHWSIFVNGDHLINFNHDFAFCCKPKVNFRSHDVLCQRIIFYGP